MPVSKITVFRIIPRELFRNNNGYSIRLREWAQHKRSYDIVTMAGRVVPKALEPDTYRAPNGASMRPDGFFQRRLVEQLRGDDVVVYSVSGGTPLPNDLILVHEHHDHYSLQAAKEMSLQELNTKITSFLNVHGRSMTREQWLQAYKQVR